MLKMLWIRWKVIRKKNKKQKHNRQMKDLIASAETETYKMQF